MTWCILLLGVWIGNGLYEVMRSVIKKQSFRWADLIVNMFMSSIILLIVTGFYALITGKPWWVL